MSGNSSATINKNGVGFLGLLTIVFAIAKLLGYFPYSWWWVFAPVIFGTVMVILLLVVFIILAVWLDG